jgi:cytidine deaminase
MEFTFKYDLLEHYYALPKDEISLVELANKSMENAYAPYSKFRVGAALRMKSGKVISGNNQENIAYPSGLCAERVALFYANANFPDDEIEVICITAKGDLISEKVHLSPCGSCRQVLLESENRQTTPLKVILVNQNNKTIVVQSAKELLPFGFTEK